MPPRFLGDLAGTLLDYFRIGAGVRLKNVTGRLDVRNAGDTAYIEAVALKYRLPSGANFLTLETPALTGNSTFIFPVATAAGGAPSAGQAIIFDGTKHVYSAVASNAELTVVEAFNQGTASPLTVFNAPANAVIKKVTVKVLTAAAGGSPTLSVGITGTPAAYMTTTENSLREVANYEVEPHISVGASAIDVIATIVASSQTFTGEIHVTYALPV